MDVTSGYARIGGDQVAYHVMGEGPIDFVMTSGWWSSFDVEWEDPAIRLFYQEMASDGRFIHFDRRGSGASDPISIDTLPPLESFAGEIEAVMDAVGSEQAVVTGATTAGPAVILFAATRPERTKALILHQTTARSLWAEDYPEGIPPEVFEERQQMVKDSWGSGEVADVLFPSRAGNERFASWFAKVQRSITSPRAVEALLLAEQQTDVRALLPSIEVPTLVIHRTSSALSPLAWGRYLADHIEGARLVEIPGEDLGPFWEHPEATLDAVNEFVNGIAAQPRSRRQLATVLFTDIVDSTGTARDVGDRRWRSLLEVHDEIAIELVEAHEGRLIKQTGDGILALFDGPGRAIRTAQRLVDELTRAGIEIRLGIHTGEVELRDDDVSGLAVNLASRIMSQAGPGEIFVSRTVKDLVVGSSFQFLECGPRSLKGIEGEWELFAVDSPNPKG